MKKVYDQESQLRVGFQGVPGSFSEQALLEYFDNKVKTYAVQEFNDVFLALKYNKVDFGILPFENSSTGAIAQVYDLLNQYKYYIVGEVCLKINHYLLGIKGTNLEDIQEVYSHSQAFEQSWEFLKRYPNWKLIPYYNTAKSAERVQIQKCKSMAAIGSQKASKLYNLAIIAGPINSNRTNTTRFVIIGKELKIDETCNKISIVLSTEHKAGRLYNVLRYFAENDINMFKIESRPIQNKPWEYYFYIDFEGNLEDAKVRSAIEAIKKNSLYFKILGHYKPHHGNAL